MQQTFATFCNNFHQGYEQKLFQLCYFLMSCVSDSPINAFFKNIIYTLSRNQWWLLCSDFLLLPNVFFPSWYSQILWHSQWYIPTSNFFWVHSDFFHPRFNNIIVKLQVSRAVVHLLNNHKKTEPTKDKVITSISRNN